MKFSVSIVSRLSWSVLAVFMAFPAVKNGGAPWWILSAALVVIAVSPLWEFADPLGIWLSSELVASFFGPLAIPVALFGVYRALLLARSYTSGTPFYPWKRYAFVAIGVFITASLVLPIWQGHTDLRLRYHEHFILDSGHIH